MVDPKAPLNSPQQDHNKINPPPPPAKGAAPAQPQQERGRTDRDPDKGKRSQSDRPTQADIDKQRLEGANSTGNWKREEGEVIGENPASIDSLVPILGRT